jgi:hypothetical protein
VEAVLAWMFGGGKKGDPALRAALLAGDMSTARHDPTVQASGDQPPDFGYAPMSLPPPARFAVNV